MENLKIENASIIYKNFSGTRDEYHPGRRTFHVVLDEDEAAALEADGWNVRHKPSKADPSVMLSPSKWTAAGRSGIKAYLKTAYVTIEEDDLDLKYAALLEEAMARAGEFNPAPGDDDENVPF